MITTGTKVENNTNFEIRFDGASSPRVFLTSRTGRPRSWKTLLLTQSDRSNAMRLLRSSRARILQSVRKLWMRIQVHWVASIFNICTSTFNFAARRENRQRQKCFAKQINTCSHQVRWNVSSEVLLSTRLGSLAIISKCHKQWYNIDILLLQISFWEAGEQIAEG